MELTGPVGAGSNHRFLLLLVAPVWWTLLSCGRLGLHTGVSRFKGSAAARAALRESEQAEEKELVKEGAATPIAGLLRDERRRWGVPSDCAMSRHA